MQRPFMVNGYQRDPSDSPRHEGTQLQVEAARRFDIKLYGAARASVPIARKRLGMDGDDTLADEFDDVAAMIAQLSERLDGCKALEVDIDLDFEDADLGFDDVDNSGKVEYEIVPADVSTKLVDSLESATRECEALMDRLGVDCEEDDMSRLEATTRALGRVVPADCCDDEEKIEDDGEIRPFGEDVCDSLSDVSVDSFEDDVDRPPRDTESIHAQVASILTIESPLSDELSQFAKQLEALSTAITGIAFPHATSDDRMVQDRPAEDHPADELLLNLVDAVVETPERQILRRGRATPSEATTSTETISRTAMEEIIDTLPKKTLPTTTRLNRGAHVFVCRGRRRSLPLRFQPRKKDTAVLNLSSAKTRNSSSSTASTEYWNEFQRKSFTRHISRQQLARLQAVQAQVVQQRLVEERYRQSATLHKMQKHRQHKAKKQASIRSPAPAMPERSYLDQFQSRHEVRYSSDANDTGVQEFQNHRDRLRNDEANRVLCAIYKFSHRRDSVVYMTFGSLVQLRQRIASRLGVSRIVNIYRERCSSPTSRGRANKSAVLQRVSSFDEIEDGDTLCVTQDSYEDMAILCEWMTQRRQLTATISPQIGNPPSKVKPKSTGRTPSPSVPGNATPALRRMVEGDAVRNNRRAAPPIWDANGRSIRAGDAAYRVDCNIVIPKN